MQSNRADVALGAVRVNFNGRLPLPRVATHGQGAHGSLQKVTSDSLMQGFPAILKRYPVGRLWNDHLGGLWQFLGEFPIG